jgi:actin-binding LIM protein
MVKCGTDRILKFYLDELWLQMVNISIMFAAAHSRSSGKFTLNKAGSKSGMKVLVDSIRTEMPRPKSPHMNNEEPIELAHFPAAKRPGPGEKPKIERDDFPAPPYPYTDPGKCAQN